MMHSDADNIDHAGHIIKTNNLIFTKLPIKTQIHVHTITLATIQQQSNQTAKVVSSKTSGE